jgi:hypothetical protein
MKTRRRRVWLVLLALGVQAPPVSGEAAPERPKLAVILSIDGMGFARLEQYRPWYVAGLKRLLDEGLVETACRYRHLNTETGPGHSSLSTGAPPRVSGVVANRWFERASDGSLRVVAAVQQRDTTSPSGTISGPGNLRVGTLADRLVSDNAATRVVALSAKDRSAILLAGRARSHAVYWFNQDAGRFMTSAAYEPPAQATRIVEGFGRSAAAALLPHYGLLWRKLPLTDALDIPASARPAPALDLLDFQTPVNGLAFDHDLRLNGAGYFAALYTSPFVDEMVTDLALAFLRDSSFALGRGAAPDVLAISYSAQDTVSHAYGSESEENLDVLRRLDVQIGRLLDSFDAVLPRGSVALALSADHGFTPIPEAVRARDKAFHGGRLLSGERAFPSFIDRMNRLISEELCLDKASSPIFGGEGWNLVYNHPGLPMKRLAGACGPAGEPVTSQAIDRVLPGIVRHVFDEELEGVLLVSERERWPANQKAVEFARNDLDLQRSGDVFLLPRPGVLMSADGARGSGHGSHHEFDTHVPLIFWGKPFKPGRSDADTTPYDLAPTLARLLGVTLPDAVGRDVLAGPALR